MIAPVFVDTNVFIYYLDTTDAKKHAAAKLWLAELWQNRQGIISYQVLQEFYVQATRAARADALAHDVAVGLIRAWRRFPVQETTLGVLDSALEIVARHRIAYWDACIVAAALTLGCERLYSEDMSHGQRIGALTIFNPFA